MTVVIGVWRPAQETIHLQLRMQLVVMAMVLALAAAGQGCSLDCHPTNITITVESCGVNKAIETTVCAGQCYQRGSIFVGLRTLQNVCNSDWSYEVMHIEDCPVGVTYPIARNCRCMLCDSKDTSCDSIFPDDITNCLSL